MNLQRFRRYEPPVPQDQLGATLPVQIQVRQAAQRGVDHAGQAFLVTADGGYIYQGLGQGGRILGKVKI